MVVGAPSRCTRLHSCQRRVRLEFGGRGSVAEAYLIQASRYRQLESERLLQDRSICSTKW